MQRIFLVACAVLLAGCAIDQSRLGNFVNQTVQPGMPMDQALVRMQAEGFYCAAGSGSEPVVSCTRSYERLLRANCQERVDLVRSATSSNTVGAIEILQVKCPK